MDAQSLAELLAGLPIRRWRYFDHIGSTNDEALRWVAAGAEDGCLVVADHQTQGRGRFQRRWVTRPGRALAFSLILQPTQAEMSSLGFFSPLGALAISQALEDRLGLAPQIKWPNDVLLERRKVAGILVEAAWLGEQLQGLVIGIGVNIAPDSVPPAGELLFPATSVEEAARRPVAREALFRAILQALFAWRAQMRREEFRHAWEQRLAFQDEWVRIEAAGGAPITGQVAGIDAAGSLLLKNVTGKTVAVAVGDVHLRPMD